MSWKVVRVLHPRHPDGPARLDTEHVYEYREDAVAQAVYLNRTVTFPYIQYEVEKLDG